MAANIRRIEPADEAGLATYVRIRSAVMPDNADSMEQARWEDATYPGEVVRLLAEVDGQACGTASAGRIWMYGPEYAWWWVGVWVEAGARRRGLGTALLRAASDAARSAAKTGFRTQLSDPYPDGLRFLASRGFVEIGRNKMVRLPLAGVTAPDAAPPAGIRLVTLAERPDLVPAVHGVAVEAFPDIRSGEEPIEAGPCEAFVARHVDRVGIPHDAFFVAIDKATDEAAGYASLIYARGGTALAYHDMTAVRPAYRGRGIATALKRATIAWAIRHGLEALETSNDEGNAPMRAVNLALGYRPIPDMLRLQGPLAPPA